MKNSSMKEYTFYASIVPPGENIRVFGIRPNNYNSRISQIKEMVDIAKKDFPGLTDNDIKVVLYIEDQWRFQTRIEWSQSSNIKFPEKYKLQRLEPLFNGK